MKLLRFALALAAGCVLSACDRSMDDQPKFLPDQRNIIFPEMKVNRAPVAHTVPRGPVEDGSVFYTGKNGDALAVDFPVSVNDALVTQGRELFEINCSVCHGRDGYGRGMIVQRGFPPPPSFHEDRLRNAPVGHLFDVITNGYGAMYPFGSRINPAERWAIVSYIRVLQFSQNAPPDKLEATDSDALEKAR